MKNGKIIVLLLMASFLTGCQGTSEDVPAVSDERTTAETQRVQAAEQFTSPEGTMEYVIHIDQEIPDDALSVIEVTHRKVDGEDARRMAELMLPGKEFTRARPNADRMSKIEFQEKLELYSQFTDRETLRGLYGHASAQDTEKMASYVNYLRDEMQKAPDREKAQALWELRPQREHFNMDVEIGNRPIWEDDDYLFNVTRVHGVEMLVDAAWVNLNGIDRSVMGISRHCQFGEFEDLVLRSRMFRTEKPTEEKVDALKATAEGWLNQLDLGQWKVEEARVEEKKIGEATEYIVYLEAFPVVNGIPSMTHSNGTIFRTQTSFQLSANGEVYYFNMDSPIAERTEVSDQVFILPMDKILEKARMHLESQVLMGTGKETRRRELEQEHGEKIIYKTEITDLEIRLGKMEMPGTDNRFFYVPFVGFRGTTSYVGTDSGTRYAGDGERRTLFWVYSYDGSIIP